MDHPTPNGNGFAIVARRKKPSKPAASTVPEPSDGADIATLQAEAAATVISEEVYFRERHCLIDIEQKGSEQHDKAILQLAMAALGFSVAFVEKIAPEPEPWTLKLLYWSWTFFAVSLGTVVGSFLSSQAACRLERDFLDTDYRNQEISTPRKNKFSTLTIWLNRSAYATFILGVVFLLFFSGKNLQVRQERKAKELPMRNETIRPAGNEGTTKGAVPPSRPASPAVQTTTPAQTQTPASPTPIQPSTPSTKK